jgi:hypothetical protein
MSSSSRNQPNFLWLRLGIIVLSLILVLGLFATNYKSGAIFFSGILLFPLGLSLLWLCKKTFLFLKQRTLLLIIALCFVLILFLLFIFKFTSGQGGGMGNSPPYNVITTDIKKYQASIKPIEKKLNEFKLEEKIVFKYSSEFGADEAEKLQINEQLDYLINENERLKAAISRKMGFLLKSKNIIKILNKSIELELERSIYSKEAGFALRKISFTALEDIRVSLPSINNSSPLAIEVSELPKGSFYRANKQKDIEEAGFLDNKIIEWSTDDISEKIEFAYFPFPYYHFSSFLKIFAGVSSFSNGILILLGLVSATVTTEIIKPIIMEKIQESVKQRLDKIGKEKEASAQPEPEGISGSSSVSDQPEASTVNEVPPQVSTETKNNDKNDEPK